MTMFPRSGSVGVDMPLRRAGGVEFVGPDLGRVTTETIFEPRLGDLPESHATRDAASTRSRSRNSPPPSRPRARSTSCSCARSCLRPSRESRARPPATKIVLRPPPPACRRDRRPGQRAVHGPRHDRRGSKPPQIAENLQRADMHPIQALIDRHRESAKAPTASPTRSATPQLRLRPPQAPGGVVPRSARPAWPARSGSDALLIARLRTPKLQEKLSATKSCRARRRKWRNRP